MLKIALNIKVIHLGCKSRRRDVFEILFKRHIFVKIYIYLCEMVCNLHHIIDQLWRRVWRCVLSTGVSSSIIIFQLFPLTCTRVQIKYLNSFKSNSQFKKNIFINQCTLLLSILRKQLNRRAILFGERKLFLSNIALYSVHLPHAKSPPRQGLFYHSCCMSK